MNKSNHPVSNPVVVLREEFDEWAVLFNPDIADAIGINPVGVSVWKMLDSRHPVDKITEAIEHEYSDVPEASQQEISDFINSLVERGFAGYELETKEQ